MFKKINLAHIAARGRNLVLTALVIMVASLSAGAAQDKKPAPKFVTSSSCQGCHEKEHANWQKSHHAWALKLPDETSVLGNFNDQKFEHRGVSSRFYRDGAKYVVETDGPSGKLETFEVKYAVGVTPLQQYLVELPGGRLQALDLAWDTKTKQWFHLYPDQDLKSGDGLHWTGPYKNWNSRCAVCHQTDFRKNYSPKEDVYQSKWSETTVGCETCHGPGEAHLAWAKEPASFDSAAWGNITGTGFAQAFAKDNPAREIETCAQCHSRRSTFTPNSPPATGKFDDYHRLALLRQGLYHADGQIDDEVYVYGSFLQSKMFNRGVRCSNCHEPHSGELKAEGNAVCTQCHSESGNTDFPTLTKKTYDAAAHHKHPEGSPGAQCVSCHMPAKTYMQVDPRRDHSFRVPRPDLSAKISTPNACSTCHQDKPASWASAQLKEWYPEGRMDSEHFAELIHIGRTMASADNAMKLVELAADKSQPAIVRATALSTAHSSLPSEALKTIAELLKDEAPLVRSTALRVLDRAPQQVRVALAMPMLSDPIRAVRLEAARLFIGIDLNRLEAEDRKFVELGLRAYRHALLANADFPETHMQIAGMAMSSRKFDAAQQALQAAARMDPQMAQAWLTLARIQTALGDGAKAAATLEAAARKLPNDGQIQLQLGIQHARAQNHAKATAPLEKSLKLLGNTPVALELLAIGYMRAGDLQRARSYAETLMSEYIGHQPSPLVQQLLKMPKLKP